MLLLNLKKERRGKSSGLEVVRCVKIYAAWMHFSIFYSVPVRIRTPIDTHVTGNFSYAGEVEGGRQDVVDAILHVQNVSDCTSGLFVNFEKDVIVVCRYAL